MTNTEHAAKTSTVVHAETYRGHDLTIVEVHEPAYTKPARHGTFANGTSYTTPACEVAAATWRSVTIDGRSFRTPVGTVEQVARKLRAMIDVDIADAEILPRLESLIANVPADMLTEPAAPLAVGDVAVVYAMGHNRRGIVTKVSRTRTEIAYTTASSGGRVFRKAVTTTSVRVIA